MKCIVCDAIINQERAICTGCGAPTIWSNGENRLFRLSDADIHLVLKVRRENLLKRKAQIEMQLEKKRLEQEHKVTDAKAEEQKESEQKRNKKQNRIYEDVKFYAIITGVSFIVLIVCSALVMQYRKLIELLDLPLIFSGLFSLAGALKLIELAYKKTSKK